MTPFRFLHTGAIAAAILSMPAQANPQAYVASYGLDSNAAVGCSRAASCRTLAVAVGVVDPEGEVIALDAAEYGSFAVNKPMAVIGNGHALVAPAFGDAITVTATPGHIVLRGLVVRGDAPGAGIRMLKGTSLAIEQCVISGFAHGVSIETAANVRILESVMSANSNGVSITNGATADVAKSSLEGNSGAGLSVVAKIATTRASVTDSVASGNQFGFMVSSQDDTAGQMSVTRSTASNNGQFGFASQAGGVMTVGASMATGNGFGFANVPGVPGLPLGTFETLGDNIVRHNATATLGIITTVGPM